MIARMKIRARLYAAFAVVIAVLVLLVVVALRSLGALDNANDMNVHTYRVMAEAEAVLESLINIETGQRGFSLTGNEASLEPLAQGQRAFAEHLAAIRTLTEDNPAQQARLAQLATAQQQWMQGAVEPALARRRAVAAGSAALQDVVTLEQQGKGKAAMDAMRKLIDEIGGAESELLKGRAAESEALQAQTRAVLLGGGAVALLIGATVAWFLAHNITGPLQEAVGLAQNVARGNLTSRIEARSADEIGELVQALTAMNTSLAGIVTDVRQGTNMIATASVQIASGNLDLSSRTEQQASALEQTASSMEEVTSTVKQNADNARKASEMAETAGDVAARGGTMVNQVVDTMGRISASSSRVAEIIGVIDSIAFQTNILALNAAVEAARAGEQGRGFAVVAGEVRTLAQRAAAAAGEIRQVIGVAMHEVSAGSALVEQAGGMIRDLVGRVQEVGTVVKGISHASDEQLAGIAQISQAITQMDTVTQQNAALVEQAAAATQAMQEQARRLAEVVQVFVVDGHGAQGAAPATHAGGALRLAGR